MITESNLKDMLVSLGFKKDGESYKKDFQNVNAIMSIDFASKKLCYPEKIKGRERNDGFNQPENFVVFECVNRLLEKGYRPENIELEKEWHLGHDAKSGRADICVTNEKGSTLFLIECKTWGREFDKAFKDTKIDGAQLFSYWQQEQACEWLVLYASNFQENNEKEKIEYNAPTINCSDDANIVLLAEKDKSIKLYRDAHTTPERHEVWKETYDCAVYDDLIFSEDSVAYQIGVKPLLKKNLKDFKPNDKIVNKFEEILRHNNVSDKENAFNRLIALFICKLVDESTKAENDEVDFQYKQGTDTYETLQDRLQRLHRDGMEDFMHEKIYYVEANYPEWLFDTYTGQKRKEAIEDLKNTIRILKFYSNNDFAFKDVHNEELFYQNGKILVEMVQLFEKYKIVYPSKHQFLGDLFEQLLNKGFKQNEGQFFTPMPITRFIWDSLPVSKMIKSKRGRVYPKIIDYSCGAGHFLSEAVEAVNFFTGNTGKDKDNAWAKDSIYGIEKDYRLARVSKISLFMNGAGEGNIIFGDGLENSSDKGIKNGNFDILVSNPPYSVKDFKQHLQLKNNSFTLLDRIGLNGSEIEALFVERIGQLLKPQGIAAVILPSSILSNDNASYIGAREQILQNFYIRAIVALGSKTFGATGTNTVILFLEKFNEPPKKISLCKDSIQAIFSKAKINDWKDKEILDSYLSQNKIEHDAYISFLSKNASINELKNNDYFKMYVVAFSESSDVKNLLKTKSYTQKSEKEKNVIYIEKFYDYAFEIEKEKLLYFSLVYRQNTIVITAPSDNKEQQEFLGYDWSNRKGYEGIQIISPGGKMYNDSDRNAKGTLASAIRESFDDILPKFSEEQKVYAKIINTKDMLDFLRTSFSKSLRLNTDKSVEIEGRYPIQILGQVCNIIIGGTPSRRISKYFTGENLWVSIAEMQGQTIYDTKEKITDEAVAASNVKLIPAGSTLLSFKLSIGKTAIAGKDLYTNEAIAALIPLDTSQILDKYIFYIFSGKLIDLVNVSNKAFGKSLNSNYLRNNIKIPVPPISIQKEIISECEKANEEYKQTQISIEKYNKQIVDLFNELDTNPKSKYDMVDLSSIAQIVAGQSPSSKFYNSNKDGIPFYQGKKEFGTKYLKEPSVWTTQITKEAQKNDILMSVRAPVGNINVNPFDRICIGRGLAAIRITKDTIKQEYLYFYLKMIEDNISGHDGMTFDSISRSEIESIKIPLPSLDMQQKIIVEYEKIETQITEAKNKLLSLSKKIPSILDHFLK